MSPLLVLNVVGLTRSLLNKFPEQAPALNSLIKENQSATLGTVLPAVTTSVQSTFLTGRMPNEHGVVANGWYFRDLAEVHFWKQSNHLVSGEKIWETARKLDPSFTSAQICWWYNMYSSNDYAVTMRPYEGGASVASLLYTKPAELADSLDQELGPFPLFDFWGPKAGIASSDWIARCTKSVHKRFNPTLTLTYLPHLDYDLQRFGPDDPQIGEALKQIDTVVGKLVTEAKAEGREVVVLSEYGLSAVQDAVHINRVLREAGLLAVQNQLDWELLDCGACRAFAVSDHQIAHVYVADASDLQRVRTLLSATPGIERVLGEEEKKAAGLNHPRSGELIAISAPDRWFSYYYWQDDAKAPPWARQVDIHSKPGYDPLELFMDPEAPLKVPRMLSRVAMRKVGFDTGPIFNFVPFDTKLIKGSHGRLPESPEEGPIFISTSKAAPLKDHVQATEVKETLLKILMS